MFSQMRMTVVLLAAWAIVGLPGLVAGSVAAQEPGSAATEEKPFAEAFIILQLSDQEPIKQDAVLDIANNLIKHYGSPDLVDIEIVAFGPGMRLLLEGNTRSQRISSLVESGVRFVGCMNTIDTMERKTGKRPPLNEHTIPVQTGVAHVVERVRQGYVLVRP
jgi:intracellular sulfur oxidation DsrE/DsrF family protein